MPQAKPKSAAEMIAAKPLLRSTDVAEFLRNVSDAETAKRAERIIASKSRELCGVVDGYAARLETALAAGDTDGLYAEAHEIRGLAETVGLVAAGRIANGLCSYLDEARRRGLAADTALLKLYVEAAVRATRATDDATRLGDKVALELAALAMRRLAEAKEKIRK